MLHVRRLVSRSCFLSHSSFQNLSYLTQLGYKLKFIFEIYFIGVLYTLYMPPFLLRLLLEKHKHIFSSENILRLTIISYLWVPYESSMWKFHITLFIAFSSLSWLLHHQFENEVHICLPHLVTYHIGSWYDSQKHYQATVLTRSPSLEACNPLSSF